MIILQLSAGQGPIECSQAVGLAVKEIEKQCKSLNIKFSLIHAQSEKQSENNKHANTCYKSALCQLEKGESKLNNDELQSFAKSWQGSMLWVCQSQFRVKHKRKNWFFSGNLFDSKELSKRLNININDFEYQTCRSSGAGGQHVNTTDSAVKATHKPTGLSVRVESQRSQHANKKLANLLLIQKLEQQYFENLSQQEKSRWQQHWQLERGNPKRTFKGIKFKPE